MDRFNELYSPSEKNGAFGMESEKIKIDDNDDEFKDFAEIQKDLNNVTKEIMNFKLKINSLNSTTFNIDQKKEDELINDISTEIGKLLKTIKDKIDAMNKSINEQAQAKIGNNEEIAKIRRNQCNQLSKRLSDIITDYQIINGDYKIMKKNKAARLIKLSSVEPITEEQAQELAQEVIDGRREIFQQSRDKLAEIMENRDDILRIERSMRELNQMFNDLAILVNEQGTVIIQVHDNVVEANTNVEGGRAELAKAKVYQKKSRRKMTYLVCCITVIFLIILAVILGFTIKFK
jgi:syntaxin 1B/2/3